MNNKAQSLVLFVFLLPLVIALFAYVFDTCYISINKTKLNNIGELAMEYEKENKDLNEIKKMIKDNDKDIEIESISYGNIHLKKEINSIFGNIIGIKKYLLEVKLE
jgi:hypothetical protein